MSEDITIKEIAERLEVSYITALNYVRNGQIRGGRQIGRIWKVPKEEFERFLKDGNFTDDTEISIPIELNKE